MKTGISLATLTASALLGTLASAQGVDAFGPYGYDETTYESPQNTAIELRFGPYYPNIDEEFEGSGRRPFEEHFGNDTRWLLGFEVDWQLLRIPGFGSLGPGFGMGFTKMEGVTFLEDGSPAEQTTKLSILPMYGVAVLRVDTIPKKTPIPIVPYAKAGIGYAMWWTDNGIGVERAPDGSRGEDTSWGTQFALGGMLLLDVFDSSAAANVDATSGVNNSYVFVEWYYSNLDGFGSGDHMQVGTNTWMAGLAIEL